MSSKQSQHYEHLAVLFFFPVCAASNAHEKQTGRPSQPWLCVDLKRWDGQKQHGAPSVNLLLRLVHFCEDLRNRREKTEWNTGRPWWNPPNLTLTLCCIDLWPCAVLTFVLPPRKNTGLSSCPYWWYRLPSSWCCCHGSLRALAICSWRNTTSTPLSQVRHP